MDPIVVHFQPSGDVTLGDALPEFHQAVRGSGAFPIRVWTLGEAVYAVVDDPQQRVLDALAAELEVTIVAAARLDLGDPAPVDMAEIEELLPDTLSEPISFPEPLQQPVLSIKPPPAPLVICTCEKRIHAPPLCSPAKQDE